MNLEEENNNNKIISFLYNYFIKLLLFYIFLVIIIKYKEIIFIELDNEISLYEDNIDFSKYSSDIKPIALFLPQFHSIKENDKWWGKGFTEWVNVKKSNPLYEGHHQPRIPGDPEKYLGYYELINPEVIKEQIKLAKSHGIYGFGIYYYWFSGKTLLEKPISIILNNKDIDFKFFLIWANENWTRKWDGNDKHILIKQEYKKEDPEKFIKDIKKYCIDNRYIKINQKPIIGIYEASKIPNIKETIFIWRTKAKEYEIGEIYILVTLNKETVEYFQNMNLFNGAYQFSPRDSMFESNKIKSKSNSNYYLYTSILYKTFNLSNISNNFDFYFGSMVEFDNTARKKDAVIFQNYSPEQFYMLNKKIILLTKNKKNKYIFINAWNEWAEGTYLEPDKKYGYASINALSKAIFNLSYYDKDYKLGNLNNICKIAIQVHIFYEDLINEIINKINNIPVKYDLYISTNSDIKKSIIDKIIKKYSTANNYEIKIFENKGRDILPFLFQLQNNIKKYKYICHIHTKKTKFTNFGDEWRNYLYNNLLGNKDIISEIISDFEINHKLGIIFPEAFYKVLTTYESEITKLDICYMNYLFKKLNKYFRIGKKIEFPIGNMFWGKTASIYQIFDLNKIINKFPKEKNQIDGTIMHGIERFWIYLVKFNGYYYKKIFKHL